MAQISFGMGNLRTLQANASLNAATNAAPIACTCTANHNLLTGDIVYISGTVGNLAANGLFVITKTSATAFTLNNSNGSGAYTSGGTVQHVGFVAGSNAGIGGAATTGTVLVDNTVFTSVPNWTFWAKLTQNSGGNVRFILQDAADALFVTSYNALWSSVAAGKLPQFTSGGVTFNADDKRASTTYRDTPTLNMAAAGDNMRLLVFGDGGPGQVIGADAALEY